MAKILRVHELAKELGLTNQETLDLCNKLGIGVKTQSSTIIEQQADRVAHCTRSHRGDVVAADDAVVVQAVSSPDRDRAGVPGWRC